MRKALLQPTLALVLGVAGLLAPAAKAGDYGDITFTRKGHVMDDLPPAVFPHWLHRMQYKCPACHDDLFKMKAGANAVTMDELQAGKWCGACHNGKIAFISDLNSCLRCHYKN